MVMEENTIQFFLIIGVKSDFERISSTFKKVEPNMVSKILLNSLAPPFLKVD